MLNTKQMIKMMIQAIQIDTWTLPLLPDTIIWNTWTSRVTMVEKGGHCLSRRTNFWQIMMYETCLLRICFLKKGSRISSTMCKVFKRISLWSMELQSRNCDFCVPNLRQLPAKHFSRALSAHAVEHCAKCFISVFRKRKTTTHVQL